MNRETPAAPGARPLRQRLFIAISLPEPVKAAMESAQTELRRAVPHGVRWTRRDQFHLTLKFLGDVETDRVGELIRSVRQAAAGFAPLRLSAGRIGFFPHARAPRVIWAGIRDELDLLPRLQAAIEAAVQPFTREIAEGTFIGHATLGRCPNLKRPESALLIRLADELSSRRFGEWTAASIEIIRSELAPQGAQYITVSVVSLNDDPITR